MRRRAKFSTSSLNCRKRSLGAQTTSGRCSWTLELIDLATGESVFKATAHNFPERVAVEEITHYSSRAGLTINRSHEHELAAVYNNTTDLETQPGSSLAAEIIDSACRGCARSGC